MSSIPPNSDLIGSIFQSQISSQESSRSQDAQRNKRALDSTQLARLAEEKTSEVEDTEPVEELAVRRQDERKRDGQDARDTYEQHQKYQKEKEKLYHPDPDDQPELTSPPLPDNPPPSSHIDLSA